MTLAVASAPSAASTSEVRPADDTTDGGDVTPECRLSTGPFQRQVEKYLGLRQDGKQSAKDCATIRKMQQKYEIDPADGYADLVSYRAAVVAWAAAHKKSLTGCPEGPKVVVCVDQNRQLLWVRKRKQIVFGPVPARTGRPGYATRNGRHKIYRRVKDFYSNLFPGSMPYSQFFDRGEALHASYRPIFEDPGSHGCVNLRYDDAKALWSLLRVGDSVHLWGSRKGQ
ncbi:L,D-transpeptidase [Streptomyces sp. NPDC001848]|uniref:L,D-transpeptidase n=1 Tax=Streptomyces sp. NPDC001848 TaxID=3364618 RepID=UPI003699817A